MVENGAAAVALWNDAADQIDAKFGKGFFGLRLRYSTEDHILAGLRRYTTWDDPIWAHVPRPKPRISAQRAERPTFNAYTIHLEQSPDNPSRAISVLLYLCSINCEIFSPPTPPQLLSKSQLDQTARARKRGLVVLPGVRVFGPPIWRWMSDFLTAILFVPEKDIQHQASARDGYYNKKLRKRKDVIDLRRRVAIQEQDLEFAWDQDFQRWKLLKHKIEDGLGEFERQIRASAEFNDFACGLTHSWRFYLCDLPYGPGERFKFGGRTHEGPAPRVPFLRGVLVPQRLPRARVRKSAPKGKIYSSLSWQDHPDGVLVGRNTVDLPNKLITEATFWRIVWPTGR